MIRGRVVSLETGQPLRSARARVSSGNAQSLRVDANGAFFVRVARPGSYSVDVAASGYDFISRTVVVAEDSGVALVAVMARTRRLRRNPACGTDTAVMTADDVR